MADTPPVSVLALRLADAPTARIAAVSQLRQGEPGNRQSVLSQLADAEGLLCSAMFLIDKELLEAAPRLRVVSNFGVGYNNVDVPEMDRRGILVTNTPGVLNDAVADTTMALILMASRRLVENANHVRNGNWKPGTPPPPPGFDLRGKTLGLVGFGRIAREVAPRARAFGMQVCFYDVFDKAPDGFAYCQYRPFDALLGEADIVSIHTFLAPETHHLIGARELALMKPTAWIVNTARGPIIDQAALTAALQKGAIAGASLDVLEQEPPDPSDPILQLPSAIIMPHVGSATVEARAAMLELCVDNFVAVLSGNEPRACVNPGVLPTALRRR